MFHNGCSIKAASKALYGDVPVPYANYRRALWQMESYLNYASIKARVKAVGLDDYIYGWGVGGWKNHRFTSSTEHAAIKHVEAEMKFKDIMEMIS